MKRLIKKLFAITMSMAMILSFISKENIFAEKIGQSETLAVPKANIILNENKAAGIVYGKADGTTTAEVNLYQIATYDSTGFKLKKEYGYFFSGGKNAEDLMKNLQGDTDRKFYVSYNTTTKNLEWRKDIDNKPYDFEFDWSKISIDMKNLALEFLEIAVDTSAERTRLAECLNDYCNNATTPDGKRRVSPVGETNKEYKPGKDANTNGYYAFKNLNYGYYLIDINVKNNQDKFVKIASNLVNLYDKTIDQQDNLYVNPKGALPTLEKFILGNDGIKKEDTVQIGKDINYIVSYDVPDLRNMTIDDNLMYKITDKMEKQTFKEDSLTLTLRDGSTEKAKLIRDKDYTITWKPENKLLEIRLTTDFLKLVKQHYDNWKNYKFVLSYKVVLDKDATFEVKNRVWLTYGNSPNEEENSKTEENITKVYTYKMDIQKKFSDGSNDFSEVEFQLYDETKQKRFKFSEEIISGQTGVEGQIDSIKKYVLTEEAPSDTNNVTDILKPDETGKINVYGLDSGTYYLVETKTKEGYKPVELKVTIKPEWSNRTEPPNLKEIADEKSYVTILKETDQNNPNIKYDVGVGVTVVNSIDGLLPETGSIGTIAFTITGLGLIAASISMYRKNK